MPAYDFQCETCGTVFEHRMRMTDDGGKHHPPCPACHAPASKRLFTAGISIIGTRARLKITEGPSGSCAAGDGSCGTGSCGCR